MNTDSQSSPARYSFQLLQLCTPTPKTLLLVHDKQQHRHVCTKQVHSTFLQEHCTYEAFYRHCSSLKKTLVLTEQDPDFAQLITLAGLSNTATKAALVSLSTCCQAMHRPRLAVPKELLAAFLQLKDNPGQQTVVASHHGSSSQVQMLRPFPLELPVCQVPVYKLKQQYGLRIQSKQHLLTTAPLSHQLSALESYYTTVIRLDRSGHHLKTRTWDNIQQQCCLFLGYCHSHHNRAQPTLELFLDPHLIAHYASFHLAAEHSSGTIRSFLYAANKVIQWWASRPGVQHDSFREGFKWLQALHTQVALQQSAAKTLYPHHFQQQQHMHKWCLTYSAQHSTCSKVSAQTDQHNTAQHILAVKCLDRFHQHLLHSTAQHILAAKCLH